MKLSEVIALIGAGYTKEEIEALELKERGESTGAPEPEVPKPEVPKPEALKPEALKPEAPKPEAPDNSANKELLDAISGLTKAIQVGNIRNTPQPAESAADSVEKNADKALMEIYNL